VIRKPIPAPETSRPGTRDVLNDLARKVLGDAVHAARVRLTVVVGVDAIQQVFKVVEGEVPAERPGDGVVPSLEDAEAAIWQRAASSRVSSGQLHLDSGTPDSAGSAHASATVSARSAAVNTGGRPPAWATWPCSATCTTTTSSTSSAGPSPVTPTAPSTSPTQVAGSPSKAPSPDADAGASRQVTRRGPSCLRLPAWAGLS
jgi:hypothetical protein